MVPGFRRTFFRALALVGVLLAVAAVRVVSGSRAELRRAEMRQSHGDVQGAIVHLRRAARWYAPGNPFCRSALDRLRRIALTAEREERPDEALSAWRSIRSALLSARSVIVPHAGRLREADERIADLVTAAAPPPFEAPRPADSRRRAELSRLREVPGPSALWSIVLLLGWLAWTGGAFGFAQHALTEEGRVRGTAARWWGTAIVVGFGVFVLGMVLA